MQLVDVAGSAALFAWVASVPGMLSDPAEMSWYTVVPLALAASLTWPLTLRFLHLTQTKRPQDGKFRFRQGGSGNQQPRAEAEHGGDAVWLGNDGCTQFERGGADADALAEVEAEAGQ